jgi:hypothetical protein
MPVFFLALRADPTSATSYSSRVFVSCVLIAHGFLHVVHVIIHEANVHVISVPQS